MKEYTRQKSFMITRELAPRFFKKMDELDIFYRFAQVIDHEAVEILVYYEANEKSNIMMLVELMDDYESK